MQIKIKIHCYFKGTAIYVNRDINFNMIYSIDKVNWSPVLLDMVDLINHSLRE